MYIYKRVPTEIIAKGRSARVIETLRNGSRPRDTLPGGKKISGLRGNADHELADSNCSNIDLLADLAEIIPVIV